MAKLLFFLIIFIISSLGTINERPIIGIFSQPSLHGSTQGKSYIPASYIKWLESAGSRVAVIPYDASADTLSKIFQSINGALITGGGQPLLLNTTYMKTLNFFYQRAIMANDKGDYFPIWGTCMGFQALSIITANDESVLQTYAFDSENLPLPLDFTDKLKDSKLFSKASNDVINTFSNEKSTMNLHHDGVDPSLYLGGNDKLTKFYRLISTNVDKKNKPFGSTIEAYNYPFYATQWHPERNQFEWDIEELLLHTSDGVMATQYLTNYFVNEVRKNNHQFASKDEEEKYLIYNYSPTYTGNDPHQHFPDQQIYYFGPNDFI